MKTTSILAPLTVFLFLPFIVQGQEAFTFPRDTSYTVRSTAQKLYKEYPFAVPVKDAEDPQVLSEYDVVYGYTGTRDLHADIFRPSGDNTGKLPAVICIHGGGWASGDKSLLVPLARQLAGEGYFTASVEYRLSPEEKYPAAVYDVKTAIRWLKSNAVKYQVDTTKIAVLGSSAGATLACLAGTTSGNPLFSKGCDGSKVSDRVQAIINIDGPLDFTDPGESRKDTDPAKPSAAARWFGYTYRENPSLWEQASPVNWVDGNTPPTLFINSSIPRFHAGRDEYTEVLQTYGTFYRVFTIGGTPHSFWLFDPWFDETLVYTKDFLRLVFR